MYFSWVVPSLEPNATLIFITHYLMSKAQKEVENRLRELPRHVVHTYCLQSKVFVKKVIGMSTLQ